MVGVVVLGGRFILKLRGSLPLDWRREKKESVFLFVVFFSLKVLQSDWPLSILSLLLLFAI